MLRNYNLWKINFFDNKLLNEKKVFLMTDIVVYIISIFNENDSEYEEETAYCIFHFKKLFASILVHDIVN